MDKKPHSSTSTPGGSGSRPPSYHNLRKREPDFNLDEPDFDWWLKHDSWGEQETKLLLINLDPKKNGHTFDPTKLPDDRRALHEEIWPIIEGQIFRLGRYEGLQVRRSKVNPIIIIKVMMEKDLPLSPELKAALDRCLERENRNRLMAEKPLVKQTGGKQESEVAINAEPNAPIDEGQNIDGEILYPRAKTTLLNLIYILSEMEPLRYDPKGGNSTCLLYTSDAADE